MATNSLKSDASFTEAPASWNTRYVTPEGFSCQLTIRGESGRDLLEKASIALSYLLDHGYKPDENNRGQRQQNNNSQGSSWCPIHQCQMKRFEKDGRSWLSHKTEDGTWCRGTQK
jgi:hypothetical protein